MPADDKNPKRAPGGAEVSQPEDPTVRGRRSAMRRTDDGEAFLPDPSQQTMPRVDGKDAEFFAEEYLASATTGEPQYYDAEQEVVDEEQGGPFLELEGAGQGEEEGEEQGEGEGEREEREEREAREREEGEEEAAVGGAGDELGVPRPMRPRNPKNLRRSLPR